MIKETPEVNTLSELLGATPPKPQLVVTTKGIDLGLDISLGDWNNSSLLSRPSALLAIEHGENLFELMDKELGLVGINEEGVIKSNIIIELDPHKTTMRILGKIAEALIVEECEKNAKQNENWALLAKRYTPFTDSLSNYKAVGTGLNYTKINYPTKYQPNDTQRDIVWIDKRDPLSQLLISAPTSNSGIQAGIQVKVSANGLNYLSPMDFSSRRYEVPIVYFDLNNDFLEIQMKIVNSGIDSVYGMDYHRGRNISPEIHEKLCAYYNLIYSIIIGDMKLEALL
ncbi:TPA: hypothetical protein ACH9O7_004056, partial [Escherichia coli]